MSTKHVIISTYIQPMCMQYQKQKKGTISLKKVKYTKSERMNHIANCSQMAIPTASIGKGIT